MARIGSIVQQDWHDTREGKELISSILRRNRRRLFGIIDYPNTPLSLKTKDVSYKVFLLGKAGVGKTSLISKLVGREVPVNHAETPGIQMSTVYWPAKLIQSQQIVMFKLEFWDAGEQCLKKFDHILPACKDGADAVLYVFNLANKATWEDLQPLITRSEINNDAANEILQIAVGTRYQKISIDSARERFRDFEKVWKIQILQMANVDAPKLPDGKFLDGRVGIRDVAPFLNRLVELLWEHKNEKSSGISAPARPLPQRNERVNASPALPEKQKRKNETNSRMDLDDDNGDISSASSGIEKRRSAVSYSGSARPLPQRKGRDTTASSIPGKTTQNTSERMSIDDDNDDRSSTTSSAASRRSAAGFSARPQPQRPTRDNTASPKPDKAARNANEGMSIDDDDDDDDDRSSTTSSAASRGSAAGFSARPQRQRPARDNTASPKPDKATRKTTDKMSIDGDDDDRSSTASNTTGRKSAAGFATRPYTQRDETASSASDRLTRKSVSSGRMSVDDDFDDKSSTTTSSSNSRRSGEKLTITYC